MLHQLAKHLNLTDADIETDPYILTHEEEEEIIESAVRSLKTYYEWKMKDKGMKEEDIKTKICTIDFKGMIDRDAALRYWNMCKNQNLWHQKRRQEEKDEEAKKIQELTKTWTAKFVYTFMVWASENIYKKKLIVNKYNKTLISALCFFISRDKRFLEISKDYDFSKGLKIRGVCGIGKTYLAKCIEDNELRPLLIKSMIDITEEIQEHGRYEFNLGDKKIIYLDDVGTEEATVKYYGSNISFFKQFIEKVYMKSKSYAHIIISTNLNFKDIEEKYGFRVASRMREMFNVIDVYGEDMRVKKEETKDEA